MFQFMVESCAIATLRLTVGDDKAGDILFSQDYDPGFVSRHPHQLAALLEAKAEVDDE
jgi:hypothetical protein